MEFEQYKTDRELITKEVHNYSMSNFKFVASGKLGRFLVNLVFCVFRV